MQFRETGDQRHQGKWESRKTLSRTSIAGRRVSAWNYGSRGHWRAGPEAAQMLVWTEKSWARLPELATPKKDQQNWLSQQACFFGFVLFLSNYLLLFFLSSNTFFLSFLLSCSTPCFSPFMSLLPSIFFSFFNPHKWDNKTHNCEKTRVGPKEGASQQLRQWNKFHFATPENLQDIVYLYYYFFSLSLHH